MATGYPALTGSKLKVERAKEHIDQLESEIRAFHDSNPYSIVVENERDSGDKVFRVKVSKYPPPRWGTIIGDLLGSLRTSLDYLVCDLVEMNGVVVTHNHGFPIFRDANRFESSMLGKVKGTSPKTIRLIKRLKPYQGGIDAFWQLHELRNADQHRLITTVGAAHRNVILNLTQLSPFRPGEDIHFPPIAIRPANRQYPLEDGAEVFRISAGATSRGASLTVYTDALPDTFTQEPQFTFEISFDQGQIVQGESVIPVLQQLIGFTERVIDMFDRHIVQSPK